MKICKIIYNQVNLVYMGILTLL